MIHLNNDKEDNTLTTTALLTLATIIVMVSSIADTTSVEATPTSNTTMTSTTTASSGIELSPQPIYQEHVRDVSETLINQTHAELVVEGNGTLTLPNSTETIKTTSTGSGIVSIISTFAGKITLTTEDGSENATATSYEIARSNKEEGIGKGIAIAIIHTNSTGRLAPLDGMILVGQEEFQPDGRALITFWEWQSGIPLPTATTTTTSNMEESPPLMNTSTTTNATTSTSDANATAPAEQGRGEEEEEEEEEQTTTTIPAPLLE
jgi:hypothetical protein